MPLHLFQSHPSSFGQPADAFLVLLAGAAAVVRASLWETQAAAVQWRSEAPTSGCVHAGTRSHHAAVAVAGLYTTQMTHVQHKARHQC